MKNLLPTMLRRATIGILLLAASCKPEQTIQLADKTQHTGVKVIVFENQNGTPVDSLFAGRSVIARHYLDLSKSLADSSLILVYYQTSTSNGKNQFWWSGNNNNVRNDYRISYYFSFVPSTAVFFEMFSTTTGNYYDTGTSKIVIDKIKIVIAPAETFSAKKEAVDFDDYYAAASYLGFE
ncbi:MAG: hypothetical protein KIS94_03400 [Chitinophagales bacterium]|nr:hypothetical protein [Chitinophagales bacterium]